MILDPRLPLELQLAAAGVSPAEQHHVLTFSEFLASSSAAGVTPGSATRPAEGLDTPEGRLWLATWRPYIEGSYPGPVDPLP